MSWLDEEMQKLQQEKNQKNIQYEQIIWNREERAKLHLAPVVSSLGLPQLLLDGKEKWEKAQFTESYSAEVWGYNFPPNLQEELSSVLYEARLGFSTNQEVHYGLRHTGIWIVIRIKGDMRYDRTTFNVGFENDTPGYGPPEPSWTEMFTGINNNVLILHLQQSIAKVIFKHINRQL